MKNKNIIAVQQLIRTLDVQSLRNPAVVANLVRAFGIVQWGPSVFGKDEIFKNPNQDMAGIYQTPDQISKALVYLSDFQINTYLEVGIFQGGNFLFMSEYLKRFNPHIRCIGIDPTVITFLNPEVRAVIEQEVWMVIKPVTSDSVCGQEFDLVFIDAEHNTEWVNKDWENVGKFAKICCLHDIQETTCPDVIEFWNHLKQSKKKFAEFTDCTSELPTQGIGIIHNQKVEPKDIIKEREVK